MNYYKLSDWQFSKEYPDGKSIYIFQGNNDSEIHTRKNYEYSGLGLNWKPCTKEEYDRAFEQAMERINQLNNQK